MYLQRALVVEYILSCYRTDYGTTIGPLEAVHCDLRHSLDTILMHTIPEPLSVIYIEGETEDGDMIFSRMPHGTCHHLRATIKIMLKPIPEVCSYTAPSFKSIVRT